MGFIGSYKHLEKLCGEVLNDDRRIAAYIDEMFSTPRGADYVNTWDEDLKRLRHYHWVRNQISREPGCTEKNMCDPEDELWLDAFYDRIMNQTDPLALYYKVTRSRTKSAARPVQSIPDYTRSNDSGSAWEDNGGCIHLIIGSVGVALVLILLKWFFEIRRKEMEEA